MFEIPSKYEINQKVLLRQLIPNSLKSQDKSKLKDNIKSVYLKYQIVGEDIPSLVNEEYNYTAIQIFDFEVKAVNQANYIANIYQKLIKNPCILRIFDSEKVVYSFALKRLNQQDNTEIIITDFLVSKPFSVRLDIEKINYLKTIGFNGVINKANKKVFYQEMYLKNFIKTNNKLYQNINSLLGKNFWYDEQKTSKVLSKLKELERLKKQQSEVHINIEKIKIQKQIKQILDELEQY